MHVHTLSWICLITSFYFENNETFNRVDNVVKYDFSLYRVAFNFVLSAFPGYCLFIVSTVTLYVIMVILGGRWYD